MTTASNSRVQRRAQKLAAKATAWKPGDPAKSIITLTEAPGGGFTIGMGLHGARMEEMFPGESFPISVVDVLALAINHTLRTQPVSFQESVSLVNATLRNVQQKIDGGESIEDAMAGVDDALSEVVGDVEAAADEPELVAANG